MTNPSQPLPDAGGSFIRNADGSLRPAQDPETSVPPAPEPVEDKPAAKAAKQAVKEA